MNRSRGAYDITLDDGTLKLGFTLARGAPSGGSAARPAVVTTDMSPARLDEAVRNADVPRVIDNLDAGMGFSRRIESVPNGYAHCLPGYTRAPGGIFCPAGKLTEVALPAAGAWAPDEIIESVLFRGDIHLLTTGRHQLVIPAGTGPVGVSKDGGAAFVGQGHAVFNNRLYVGGSFGGLMYRDGASGSWVGPVGVDTAKLRVANWRPQGVPTPVMVAVAPANAVRWCPITADPMVVGNWSAPVPVGADQAYGIHELVAAPRHVYMLRPDGVYDMDELGARAFNIAPWMEEGRDIHNGLWGLHVGQGLYYGHTQGLAYVPTAGDAQYEPSWAHPGWGLPFEGPIRGVPRAGTLHDGWRIVAITDSVQSYICAGLPTNEPYGRATHVWHGAEAVVPDTVTHMKVHTTSPAGDWPQLLIATSDGAPSPRIRLYWQSLARIGTPITEMLLGGEFVPADAASLFLPADPWGRPSSVKTMLQFDLLTERLTEQNVLRLYAAADEGAYVEQGRTTLGTSTAMAPLELTEGRYIKTRIDAVGSPILRSVELRAAVGVELREARVYQVVLGYDNGLKGPAPREQGDPERRLSDLRSMLGRVVTLHDGAPVRVRVLQVLAPERRQLGAPNRAGAWAMTAGLMVSILDHPFRHDGPDAYDTERTWG